MEVDLAVVATDVAVMGLCSVVFIITFDFKSIISPIGLLTSL